MDSGSRNQNVGGSEQLLDHQRPVYVFTPEELKVLQECNRESLLFRCIPFGALFGSATYYAIYKGMLKPSPRFGFLPKTLGAAFLGYILGKVSYQKTCVDKILQLPNSKLADSIRKNKGIRIPTELLGVEGSGSSAADEVFTQIPQKPIFDDHKPEERDRNEGLEEYQRVTDSLSEYTLPAEGPAGAPVLSYDERKRINREEYNARTVERLRRPGGQLADLPSSTPPSTSAQSSPSPVYRSSSSSPPPSAGRRNKYGDIVYEE